jgi:hypothetical protein
VVLAGVVFSLALQTLVREDVYFSGDGGMKALLARHVANCWRRTSCWSGTVLR